MPYGNALSGNNQSYLDPAADGQRNNITQALMGVANPPGGMPQAPQMPQGPPPGIPQQGLPQPPIMPPGAPQGGMPIPQMAPQGLPIPPRPPVAPGVPSPLAGPQQQLPPQGY